VVPPQPGFTEAMRRITRAHGALLISDEVMTGFRCSASGWYGLEGPYEQGPADLFTFGKVMGGGFPAAAFGGRADVMAMLAPFGPVYQAGTLSGNPLATAAGLAVLRRLHDGSVYEELERKGARLEQGLAAFGPAGLGSVQRVGAMLTLFMTDRAVRNFEDAQACDTERYGGLFRHLLSRGIYLAPSQFEAMFVSLAHSDDDIDLTVEAVGELCQDD
jgi:glutamate-1-semialdehyde 2,1-aminomutase